jgi:DHA2 family multidrug resistance protein
MEHVTDSTTSPLHAFSGLLFSRGMDQFSAGEGALRMLDEFVMQQASMLSYNRVFFFTSLLFVIATPLVFVLKDTRKFKKPEVS